MADLQLIEKAEAAASVRERELEVGRLVVRAAADRDAFLLRRAADATAGLDAGPARRALRRAVQALQEEDGASLRLALGMYGGTLERHGAHDAASEVYEAAMRLWPGEAELTLHAARAARRSGRREAALALYRQAGRECRGNAHMFLLVRIGEALVSEHPADLLTAVIQAARRMGDADAVAVAREERSRHLLAAGRRGAALRDLASAAGRYTDGIDRVRVLHRMSELLIASGDLPGAREVLLAAVDQAAPAHRGHGVQRLRTVARALGDELELRRSRGRSAAGPVSLTPSASLLGRPAGRSMAPRLRRWCSLLERARCRG
jgi:tetratricopeptide (TPR) repeat protein